MAHAPLHPDARSFLAREVGRAREIAEKGARASLTALAVADKVVPAHFTEAQRKLRNRLRAHARQLGDERTADGQQEVNLLTEEVAYQHWHRMLFARFLAENGLLREDEGDQPIDLDECRALAADRRLDIWVYAALCAQKMLPGVFRLDDPALELKLDGAAQVELNTLMAGLQPQIFKATDALGWVYQYWQDQRKKEVNLAMQGGLKVGAKELSPVTQLFTEDYMVDFLLHNTLGAWWAGKMGPIEAATEEEARVKAGLAAKNGLPAVVWTYLRFIQDADTKKWVPAGGIFDGWPKKAKDITFLDPCMGSGHFPVFALPILARLRMEEEAGNAQENIRSVLREQIHCLELDQRCCQIGAFNLGLSAWKLAGFQELPAINVACCGIAPSAKADEWLALARGDEKLRNGMQKLYRIFKDAPILGSLINPDIHNADLFEANIKQLQPLLDEALNSESDDDASMELKVAAHGLAKAAGILSRKFTLVSTNVPYLGSGKQHPNLRKYCEQYYPEGSANLETAFLLRCMEYCEVGGSAATVIPQNWLFLKTYKEYREILLRKYKWSAVCRLGAKGFWTPMWDFNVMLPVLTNSHPGDDSSFAGLDVSTELDPGLKASSMPSVEVHMVPQRKQLNNPRCAVVFENTELESSLSEYVTVHYGAKPGQTARVIHYFWEIEAMRTDKWAFMESSPKDVGGYTGKSKISYSLGRIEREGITEFGRCGSEAWGKKGFILSKMASLPISIYCGELFDDNTYAVIPNKNSDMEAIYAFICSDEYRTEVRKRNQKLAIDTQSMISVPFEIEKWRERATSICPVGIPAPISRSPSQWLFSGYPSQSDNPMQVAVARLLSYQWPRQTGSAFPDCPTLGTDGLEKHADDDGIVPLGSINREDAAASRVRALLKDAYGADWLDGVTERQLLADSGHGDSTLEEWLRDSFFEEHCKLFHHRPFVWHIWDGERDGFHALVNYHRLAAPNGEGARLLQKLAQTYLGDWIARCEADVKNDKPNAHKLLMAAKDLQADLLKILEGEAPHDIFVRWKPLHEQPIGWNPDINDGLRLNIRPFLTTRDVGKKGAGVLRWKPNIQWEPDSGDEAARTKSEFPWLWSCSPEAHPEHVTDFAGGAEFTGERWNNLHYTLAAKKAARTKFIPKK